MSAADPFAVLGVRPGASADEVAASYRRLAKRWHPDRAPGRDAERRMAQINAAYDQLREGGPAADPAPPPPPAAPAAARTLRPAGWWLPDPVRRSLGPELAAVLRTGEHVDLVLPAATWAGSALVAVTDRRLLWLHDDAVTGRVRALRWIDALDAEVRASWPLRRRASVRVAHRRSGRRTVFTELAPGEAERLARQVRLRASAASP